MVVFFGEQDELVGIAPGAHIWTASKHRRSTHEGLLHTPTRADGGKEMSSEELATGISNRSLIPHTNHVTNPGSHNMPPKSEGMARPHKDEFEVLMSRSLPIRQKLLGR